MKTTKSAYVDKVDFDHHLDGDARGIIIYPSLEDLKEKEPCVKRCGAYMIEVSIIKTVIEENFLGDDEQTT